MFQTSDSKLSTVRGFLSCSEGRFVSFNGNQQIDHNPGKFGKLLLLCDFEKFVEYLLCVIIQKNDFRSGSRFVIFK